MSYFLFFLSVSGNARVLSLDSRKVYAPEYNRRIKEALLKVDGAGQVKKNTYTRFFPDISASVMGMKASDCRLSIETPEMNLPAYDGNIQNLATAIQFAYVPSIKTNTLDYMNIGLVSAVQPVYAGGKVRTGYKLASLGKTINEKSLEFSREEVLVKTEQYYWTLVSLQAKRKTLSSYERLLNNLQKDVQVSFDAGLIEKSDLLKVKMKISEVEASKLKLENGIEMLKMALCQHIGINYNQGITLQEAEDNLTDIKNTSQIKGTIYKQVAVRNEN